MLKYLNFKIGLFFLVFALLFAIFIVPTVSDDWRKTAGADVEFFTIGPRFFPFLTAGIMAALSILLMIDTFSQLKTGKTPPPTSFNREQFIPVLMFMAIGALYIFSISFLGVLVATPLCLVAYFRYFDIRKWGWLLLLSFGITAAIYFCFEKLMMVPLPRGFLEP